MKKNYQKLKIKLIAIVLIVLVVGSCVLTYQKADDLRSEYTQMVQEEMYFDVSLRMNEADESEDFIQQVYEAYYEVSRDSDVGFYSMLKDADGNTLAEDQNFIIVYKWDESDSTSERRVALLGDDFVSDDEGAQIEFSIHSFSELEIIGTCDDTFLYIDELRWSDNLGEEHYSYIPEKNIKEVPEGTAKFEEWAGSRYYSDSHLSDNKYYIYVNTSCFTYGDWNKNTELNKEAKKICEQIYLDDINGIEGSDYQANEGIFTTYIGNQGYLSDEYKIPYVFVFHPVSMAMDELLEIYIIVGMHGVLIIAVIWFLIEKIYKQQLAYENNRRELTRGIAHELKTPLAIAKGYVENWEYLDETERHDSSKIIIDEIEHMDRMVTDLLELSHLEAKTKKLNLESVDIQALSRSVVGRMKSIIAERQLSVNGNINTEETDSDKYLVEADLEMMRIVLVNFISNAVKYADREIYISLSENGKKVKFVITNDGQTIEKDKLPKVWDEFYRDATVDLKRIGGSGLGLAITKNVLILHEARFGCESEDGKTSFWFEIKKK